MKRTPPTPPSPSDRDLRRAAATVDTGWDQLGPDPIKDYSYRSERLRSEDRDW